MIGYFSHHTAADIWNIPYLESVFGSAITQLEMTAPAPIHISVAARSDRSQRKGQIIHLRGQAMPFGAVVSRNGKKVASPELTFLDLACNLDIHRLILLGLQLCSHPPGDPSKALTTKQNLKNFLERTTGHHGHIKASRALKFIENGSASIMESIVFMLLTLPHTLGGYGLYGAVFNYEFKLKDEVAMKPGRKRCFTDLYYKSSKVAIEYESFAFHNNPTELGKDAMRSAIIERRGVEVMHLSTIQLYNKDAFYNFTLNLASRLGKRMQIRAQKFGEMHSALRELLPKPAHNADSKEM